MTKGDDGQAVPKQFCRLDESQTMFRWAMRRAVSLVSRKRLVPVVAAHHRHFWENELAGIPPGNVIVQPQNRGTAAGVLLPLMSILERDPLAAVLILPSDHYAHDERPLRRAVVRAFREAQGDEDRVVMIGMPTREADGEYGWIVPSPGDSAVPRVDDFVEKPDDRTAELLMRRGAVLNTFILVAGGRALLRLYRQSAPGLLGRFEAWREAAGNTDSELGTLYQTLPVRDFSMDVLKPGCRHLFVVLSAECGWVDLGTPKRLMRHRGQPSDHPGVADADHPHMEKASAEHRRKKKGADPPQPFSW